MYLRICAALTLIQIFAGETFAANEKKPAPPPRGARGLCAGLNQVLSRCHPRQPSRSVVPPRSSQKPEEGLLEGFGEPRSITALPILRRKSVKLEDGYAGQKAYATSRAARKSTGDARSHFRCSRPNIRQAL